MSTPLFSMSGLLRDAGFVLRGASRADCAHCHGHSRGTVVFSSEVAFCHRCKWRANIVMLAREAGLLHSDPQSMASIRDRARRRQRLEFQMQKFESWREGQIRRVSDYYRRQWRAANQAAQVLAELQDCEPAWCALARFYHAQARLSAILDWLMFAKASNWLDADSTAVEVYESWRRYAA